VKGSSEANFPFNIQHLSVEQAGSTLDFIYSKTHRFSSKRSFSETSFKIQHSKFNIK